MFHNPIQMTYRIMVFVFLGIRSLISKSRRPQIHLDRPNQLIPRREKERSKKNLKRAEQRIQKIKIDEMKEVINQIEIDPTERETEIMIEETIEGMIVEGMTGEMGIDIMVVAIIAKMDEDKVMMITKEIGLHLQ